MKRMNESLYRLLTLFAFVLFSMYCRGDNKSRAYVYLNDINRADYGLKGPVYAVIIKDCQFKKEFGEVIRTGSKDEKIYFLSNGNIYKISSTADMYKKFLFDEHGYLTDEMTIHKEAGKRYNINGESFIDNDTTEHFIYSNTYGADGKIKEIIKKQVTNIGIQQTERIVFSNSIGGVKYICYDKNGIIRNFSRNNTVKKTRIKNSNRYFEWAIFTETFNNKGQNIKRTIVYERLNGSTFLGNSQSFELDVHGNITKSNFTSSQQKRDPSGDITIKYVYDTHGNWTSKKQYRGGNLISWKERFILYATEERDYNNIVEEDARKDEKRIARLNNFRHAEDSKLQAQKALEEADRAKGPILEFAEQMPYFPGGGTGPSNVMEWISKNIRYPQEAEENGEQGIVFVTFVIEKDGSTSNVKIIKSVSKSLDKEAIRLINSMNGWIPARSNGQIVRCRYGIRIPFRLQ